MTMSHTRKQEAIFFKVSNWQINEDIEIKVERQSLISISKGQMNRKQITSQKEQVQLEY
jgi:hypothetical protein